MNFLANIETIARQKKYRIFSRPYELNIWGIRSENTIANRFDDALHIFYKSSLKWNYHVFPATTDPGTYWLNNPMQPQGTAILKEGQYFDAYQIGIHLGKYLALVQRKPVTVYRDYDRNATLNFFSSPQTTGLYGINIHRAMLDGITRYVDKFSAGCQVFADAGHFLSFMKMCHLHESLYGNRFTYTLIDNRELKRAAWRKIAFGTAGGALALGTGIFTYQLLKKKEEQNLLLTI